MKEGELADFGVETASIELSSGMTIYVPYKATSGFVSESSKGATGPTVFSNS
jgi:hypothetical protein